MADVGSLPRFLNSVADAIRDVSTMSLRIKPNEFDEYIRNIPEAINVKLKGAYDNVSDLINSNPESGNYIINQDGCIYDWVKNGTEAKNLGYYLPKNLILKEAQERINADNNLQNQIDDLSNIFNLVFFDTVEEMKISKLTVGNTCITLGYYNVGDGGGAIYKVRLKKNQDVEDNGKIHFVSNDLVAELITNNVVNPLQFGAKGDGVTDDTIPIHNATQYLQNNNTLYFPQRTYLVSFDRFDEKELHKYIIDLKNKDNITIDFNNSTLKLKPNKYDRGYMIWVRGCKNFNIINGTLIGDKMLHDYETIPTSHELGYGIFIYRNASTLQENPNNYGNINNMDIGYFIGDSIVTQNGNDRGKIVIKDCYLHNNRRQGISILDTDEIEIIDVLIEKIGDFDGIEGTSPKSGIDIEAASDNKKVNRLLLDNVSIFDVTSRGIIFANPTTINNIEITRCKIPTFISDSRINASGCLYDCIIDSSRINNTLGTLDAPKFSFVNCDFINAKKTLSADTFKNCNVLGDLIDDTKNTELKVKNAENCTFENVILRQNSSSLLLTNFKKCILKNITFRQYALRDETKHAFIGCVITNVDMSDSSNIAQQFDGCILDAKFKTNHILNNCIILSD